MKAIVRIKKAGLSAHALKTIAVAAMLIDHLGAAFYPLDNVPGFAMRIIGRLTAPIMCFFIAEGYHRTRSIKRYAVRLGIFALISHVAFYYAWKEHFPLYLRYGLIIYPTSVIYPLLLGLFALALWHKEGLSKLVKILAVIALSGLSIIGDWGPLAVLWVFIFGIYHNNFAKQAISFSVLTLVYSLLTITTGFGFAEQKIMGLIQLASFLTLPLLRAYNGQLGGGQRMKWFFYWFYPLHLLIIGIIKHGFPFLPKA